MGVIIDCRPKTIEQYGHCVEAVEGLPTAAPDVVKIFSVDLNAYQLTTINVLFIIALAFAITLIKHWRSRKK